MMLFEMPATNAHENVASCVEMREGFHVRNWFSSHTLCLPPSVFKYKISHTSLLPSHLIILKNQGI